MKPISTRTVLTTFTVLAAAALTACSSVKLDDAATTGTTAAGTGGVGGTGSSAGAGGAQSRVAPVDAAQVDNAAFGNLPRVVYFDFDSYVVKAEDQPKIEANARALAANRSAKMSVQGHTDERGSSEYNLALGQRRAEAVVRALTLVGAQPTQLEAVSFGKERPVAQGSTEEAWAQNRRAEMVAAVK